MRYGTIIEYFAAKGFGFIRPDSGPDIFFHVTALKVCDPEPQINPGQPVKYELVPGTEAKCRSRSKRSNVEATKPEKPVRPRAKLVELIDKIPGAILEEDPREHQSARHPRARKKKPSWRK
jgi:cold shock CspA family protein